MKTIIAFLKWFNRGVTKTIPQVGDTILFYGLYPWKITSINGDFIWIKGSQGSVAQTRLSYGGWAIIREAPDAKD